MIAVTSSHNKEDKICMSPAYFRAVYQAGGIASFLPSFEYALGEDSYNIHADSKKDRISQSESQNVICDIESYAESFDGFIFAGGVDVHPSFYGEDIASDKIELDIKRDLFEAELLRAVMKKGKPVLGICRGIQLINVVLGGSLYQHIDGHMQSAPRSAHEFEVDVKEGSLLAKITGQSIMCVNSFHHQAVNDIAPNLSVCATSIDGIVEGLYLDGYNFLLAVQWHPELFFMSDSGAFAIFNSFVSASSGAFNR